MLFYRGIPETSENRATAEIHRTADFIRAAEALAANQQGGHHGVESKRANSLIHEARDSYSHALKHPDEAVAELDRSELVKAAEKTWAATLQSTNALILSATGKTPDPEHKEDPSETFEALASMSCESEAWGQLMDNFCNLHRILHDTVLCDRDIEPVSVLIQDIREVEDYISECERLDRASRDSLC